MCVVQYCDAGYCVPQELERRRELMRDRVRRRAEEVGSCSKLYFNAQFSIGEGL